MADYKTLKLTFNDPVEEVATITFSRPKSLNAMNTQVIEDLAMAVSELEVKPKEIRALVLTGDGEKSFVAGADIAEMVEMTPAQARNFLYNSQQTLNRLEALPFPIIAKINGYALGGGLEITLACDIRIASDNAVLGLPEVALGIIPAAGGTQRLAKLVGKSLAKYLILTAKRINAEKALEYSIIHEVTTKDELDNRVLELVREIKGLGPIALAAAKRSIEIALAEPLNSGLEIELNNAIECFQSSDLREGMKAFLEKRKADFQNR